MTYAGPLGNPGAASTMDRDKNNKLYVALSNRMKDFKFKITDRGGNQPYQSLLFLLFFFRKSKEDTVLFDLVAVLQAVLVPGRFPIRLSVAFHSFNGEVLLVVWYWTARSSIALSRLQHTKRLCLADMSLVVAIDGEEALIGILRIALALICLVNRRVFCDLDLDVAQISLSC